MATSFKVVIDDKGTTNYLKRVRNWATIRGAPQVSFDVAEEGKRHAVNIAPRKSGALIGKIGTRAGRTKKGYIIYSKMPTSGTNARRTTPRPYHMMMHGLDSPDISGKIRSGRPKYMFETYDYLLRRYPEEFKRSLDKELKKK